MAYLSNNREAAMLGDADFRQRCAEAMARAIVTSYGAAQQER
jgi:N-acetylmuramoyl-L-alanine amidase